MQEKSNVWIYDTARKVFRWGSFRYSGVIEGVSLGGTSSSEGKGEWIVPGLVDIHMHIESSMLTPSSFALASLPHGTTTVVSDDHEIANVAGVRGLKDFIHLPTANSTFYAIPSSVPSTSALLETSGGSFDAAEVAEMCGEEKVIALGEVMNAQDLFSPEDNRTKRIIRAFRAARPFCPVEGHCPRFSGSDLDRFIAAGVDSDHTAQTPESLREKISKGMFVELQYKSISSGVIRALDPCYDGHFSLVTDDVLPDILQREGHLDRVLRRAVSCGLPVERAIYAATWSPAVRMRLFDRGWIAPGKRADFLVLDDLETFRIRQVYVAGACVWDRDEGLLAGRNIAYPSGAPLSSIRRKKVATGGFRLMSPKTGPQRILCIGHRRDSTLTDALERTVTVGEDHLVPTQGLNILASVERYGHEEPIVPVPLAGGLAESGAVCTSWSHDSHNLLVLATDPALAAKAVNMVISRQGGIACVDGERELFVPLSYGGIVSTGPVSSLADGISAVRRWLRSHGWVAEDEVMCLGVLALPVSPSLKVTDKGMVDVKAQKLVDWRLDA